MGELKHFSLGPLRMICTHSTFGATQHTINQISEAPQAGSVRADVEQMGRLRTEKQAGRRYEGEVEHVTTACQRQRKKRRIWMSKEWAGKRHVWEDPPRGDGK